MINYLKGVINVTKLFLLVIAYIQCKRGLVMRYFYSALIAIVLMSMIVSGCGHSDQQMRDEYTKSAIQADYNDIIRNPNSLKRKVLTFTAKVSFVRENSDNIEVMAIVGREGMTDLPIWVFFFRKPNEERFLVGDTIKIWGSIDKVEIHKINSLIEISCPTILAKYVDRQKVAAQAENP